MKKLILVAMVSLLVTGCGGELSLMVPVERSAPSISTYKQVQDLVNWYVTGTIDFHAPDNDVASIEIAVFNSRGSEVERTVTSLATFAGKVSGTISFTIDYYNYRPDYYSYSVVVTDTSGMMSNAVYGAFRV